ncbi:MAG: hypothetical protein O7B30_05350 [Thaumarchaeota archaeon]|nr:hypothetical protein [Nitrososphaerota archaeon]
MLSSRIEGADERGVHEPPSEEMAVFRRGSLQSHRCGNGLWENRFMLQLEFADVRMDIYGYDVFEKGVTYSKKLGICLSRSRDLGHPQQFRMKIKASTLDLASEF